jgi:hypothetical protein
MSYTEEDLKLWTYVIRDDGNNDDILEGYYLTIVSLLTYFSMEKSSSWEANWFAASQEISRILQNLKVHYRIHNCPPPVPILFVNLQGW